MATGLAPQGHQNDANSGDTMTAQQPLDPAQAAEHPADHPHDFAVQKQVHQQIRNDPDYDDWEYGTEPLPQEAWVPRQGEGPDSDAPSSSR